MGIDVSSVDLAGMFEPGQAYVALSRAKTRDGLQASRAIHAQTRMHMHFPVPPRARTHAHTHNKTNK